MSTSAENETRDLLILGGGLVGMALALAAAKQGISSHVIDRADPVELTKEQIEKIAEGIRKENERKLNEYQEKIAAAEKRVQELNSRFANWCFIIDEKVYNQIQIEVGN